ncbi:response regulator transcription factor [Duganella lactea]|nr:response regulator transcription factor [Duganella lactea]
MSMSPVQLLLIDDHTLFRRGLRLVLADTPRVAAILEADTVMDAVRHHRGRPIDLILLDIHMPGLNGLDGVGVLQTHFPSTPILIVSGDDGQAIERAAATPGVLGFLSKAAGVEQIEAAIASCLRGERSFPSALPPPRQRRHALTPRQLEVLSHLCQGSSNKVIAHAMSLSDNTVRVHIAAIFAYLDVTTRTAAVLRAQRDGLVRQS